LSDKEIIETLATKLMGWEKRNMLGVSWAEKFGWFAPDGQFKTDDGWNPLQNLADAWQVVNEFDSYLIMEHKGEHHATLYIRNEGLFSNEPYFEGRGKTIQEAICNAALKVVA
jgi:hypothetical protein